MDQEYNYNNTDYEDEFTYTDVESRFKVVKNEDGALDKKEIAEFVKKLESIAKSIKKK